jgi:hypothetical protein
MEQQEKTQLKYTSTGYLIDVTGDPFLSKLPPIRKANYNRPMNASPQIEPPKTIFEKISESTYENICQNRLDE